MSRGSSCNVSHGGHRSDISGVQIYPMLHDDDPVRQKMLDALNALVQKGFVEVVSIAEDGEPLYRLASWITDVQILSREIRR